MDEVLLHEINHLMPVYQEYVVQLIKKNDVATLRQLVRDGFEYVAQGAGVSARDVALECGANDVAEFIEQVPALMVSEHVTNRDTGLATRTGTCNYTHATFLLFRIKFRPFTQRSTQRTWRE